MISFYFSKSLGVSTLLTSDLCVGEKEGGREREERGWGRSARARDREAERERGREREGEKKERGREREREREIERERECVCARERDSVCLYVCVYTLTSPPSPGRITRRTRKFVPGCVISHI